MIAAIHAGKLSHRHVAGDTLACFAIGRVIRVCLGILNPLFVARHASMIGLGGISKPIATT